MNKTLLILAIVLILHYCVHTKQIQQLLQILEFKRSDSWQYLGKIALSKGNINIKLTTEKVLGDQQIMKPYLYIYMIPDSKWKSVKQKKCVELDSSSSFKIQNHQMLLSGEISFTQHTVVNNEQQLYYFVISDCQKSLTKDNSLLDVVIKIKLQIINNGGYMGDEQDHWLIIPVIIGIGLWIFNADKRFLGHESANDPDYAKLIVFGAISCNMSSLIWKSFGYLIYRNFGINYLLFHWIYLLMHAMSQNMTLGLLILISMGWSLNFINGTKLHKIFPILGLLIFLNLIFTLLTQLPNSRHDMYHTFDAQFGSAVIILRLLMGIFFIISIIFTYNESRYRVQEFIKKFGIIGAGYINLIPIIIWFADKIVASKDRNEFVFISIQISKTVCNIYLLYMVSSSRSEYNKLSYKNASFMPRQTSVY